jgi:hypothetical protein
MTTDERRKRDAGSLHTDQIGKVFVCVGKNVRQCLVCEQLFTRRAASEHTKGACPVNSLLALLLVHSRMSR